MAKLETVIINYGDIIIYYTEERLKSLQLREPKVGSWKTEAW
jgi:hypothetical protein